MAEKKPGPKSIKQVAEETRDAIIRYMRETSVEEMERQEAERDARVKAMLEQAEREGKLPPRQKKGT